MREIVFADSAYPEPHQLKEFVWSGRLDEAGKLYFNLHLKTEDYYANLDEEDWDEEDDLEDDQPYTSDMHWKSAIVWDNYHQCIISSTYWGEEGGILIGTRETPFEFKTFDSELFSLDTLPLDKEQEIGKEEKENEKEWDEEDEENTVAFNIYLLGHDACANHTISFERTNGSHFSINWSGLIALTYGGFVDFDQAFKATITDATFDGFNYPQTWTREEAIVRFQSVLLDFDSFEFIDVNPKSEKREYRLMPK